MKTQLASISLFLVAIFATIGCQNTPAVKEENATTTFVCPMFCEGDKTYTEPGSCPICKMDLVDETSIEKSIKADSITTPELSIFNLTSTWTTQNNQEIKLKDLGGKPFLLTMIYTTCQAACPRLVADMRAIEKEVTNPDVQFVLVSIDPENDTPEKLKEYAEANQLTAEKWILLNGSVDDVRELSNVVAVKYMRISPLDFSHSNIISLFNAHGVLAYQQEGLGVNNDALVERTNAIE